MIAVGALLLATLALPPQQGSGPDSLTPPRVSAGVTPETVTVGEPFRSYLRVRLPDSARVRLDLFEANDSLQVVDTVFVRREGDSVAVAVYPLVAWVAGDTLAQSVPLTVSLPDGRSRVYRVPLRLPIMRSVLPADTAGLRPRPAKGLLLAPSPRSQWWWVLLVPAVLAAALIAWRVARRTGRVARLDPRAEALARLARLGDAGAPEPYFTAATRVLREYLARVDARWGEDLTSDELLGRVSDPGSLDCAGLAALLARADPVKFGGLVPDPADTRRFAEEVRAWILANPAAGAAWKEAA